MNTLRFNSIVAALPAVVPFVAPETLERRSGRALLLRMGANESLFGQSPLALAAMQAASSEVNFYNDPEGFELRSEIAKQSQVALENVVLGAGIDDLLMLLCRTFLNPGESVVTSLGGYPTFNYAVAASGGEFHRAPYRDDQNDLAALSEMARLHRPKLVYLSNPDNPSGSWYTASEVIAFRNSLPEESVLLLDEAYSDFAPELPDFSSEDPGVVRTRTFSKAYGMAGARVGYAIVPSDVAAACNKHRLHFGVNRVAQAGALASLRDPQWLREVVAKIETARVALCEIAVDLGLSPLPSHTNFVTIDVGTRERAEAILAGLAERDVFIRKPGVAPLDRCIRVTVAPEPELSKFAEVLRSVVGTT